MVGTSSRLFPQSGQNIAMPPTRLPAETGIADHALSNIDHMRRLLPAFAAVLIVLTGCSTSLRNPTGSEVECWNTRATGDSLVPLLPSAKAGDRAALARIRVLAQKVDQEVRSARSDLDGNGPFQSGDDCARKGVLLDGMIWNAVRIPIARQDAALWYRLLTDFYPDSPLVPQVRSYMKNHVQ